jgi:hypothetical protein
MNTEQALLQKLAISKKIMQRHDDIGRNTVKESSANTVDVESYQPMNASYNIPQEYLSEEAVRKQQVQYENTEDKILNSRLPDEIKKLMIEHPIQQPSNPMNSSVLSDDLVEKASRLMNVNAKGDPTSPQRMQTRLSESNIQNQSLNENTIRNIVRETVEDVLRENGLLTESESKTNDIFKFRVGQHIFEGKLLKVKKIAK